MNEDKIALVAQLMAELGVSPEDVNWYRNKLYVEAELAEDPAEKAWLDQNVRGKEEELRAVANRKLAAVPTKNPKMIKVRYESSHTESPRTNSGVVE